MFVLIHHRYDEFDRYIKLLGVYESLNDARRAMRAEWQSEYEHAMFDMSLSEYDKGLLAKGSYCKSRNARVWLGDVVINESWVIFDEKEPIMYLM